MPRPPILQDYGGPLPEMSQASQLMAAQLGQRNYEFNETQKAQQQNLKDKAAADAAKAEQKRIDDLAKEMGDKYFNPKDYLTGLDPDKKSIEVLNQGYLNTVNHFQKNPNISTGEALGFAQKEAKTAFDLFYGLKATGAVIDKNIDGMKDFKNIDSLALKAYVLDRTFYTTDDKGNKTMITDPAARPDPLKVMEQAMIEKPDLWTKGGIDLAKKVKEDTPYEITANTKRMVGNKTIVDNNTIKLDSWLVPVLDKDKNFIGTKPKEDKPYEINGKQYPQVAETTWKTWNTDGEEVMQSSAETKRFIEKYKDADGNNPFKDVKPGTDEYVAVGKFRLFNELSGKDAKLIKKIDAVTQPVYNTNVTVNSGNNKDDYSWVPGRIDQMKKDAKENNNNVNIVGQQLATMSKGGRIPDGVVYSDLTKRWTVIFYKKDGNDYVYEGSGNKKTRKIDGDLTFPATDDDIANALTLGASTGKIRDKELDNNDKRRGKTESGIIKAGTTLYKDGKPYKITKDITQAEADKYGFKNK